MSDESSLSCPPIDLVVTRHLGLVRFLVRHGCIAPSVEVIDHADADGLRGKRVLGHLPLHLACLAETVTEPVIEIEQGARGAELSEQEVAKAFRGFRTYRVQEVDP